MWEFESSVKASETDQAPMVLEQIHKISYPDWQPLFHAALLETQSSLLSQNIHDAAAALAKRHSQLLADGVHQNPLVHEELTAISGAIFSLNVLRKELESDQPKPFEP